MLVGSLALAVGLAIFDLTIRELDLSSAATQSQYAIYAADTGAECALYWDSKFVGNAGSNSAFATSSADTQIPISGVICNGQDIASSWVISPVTATAATTTFTMYVSAQSQVSATTTCAIVSVSKSGTPSQTTAISRGYNTCTAGALRLERSLQVTY